MQLNKLKAPFDRQKDLKKGYAFLGHPYMLGLSGYKGLNFKL
jgi:hypothetical protein